MDFGTIAPTATVSSVVMDTTGGRTPTNVTLITGGGETAGQFAIQGNPAQTYTMLYPVTAILDNDAGGTMTTSGFNDMQPYLTARFRHSRLARRWLWAQTRQ